MDKVPLWLPSSRRESRIDPRLVVVSTFCLIAVCKATSESHYLLGFQVGILALALAAGVRAGSLLARSLLVLPFTLAALPLLFSVEGAPIFQLWDWTASREGAHKFLLIVAHCWLCFQAMLLGAAVAGPFKFIQGLGRLGVPDKLVEILELALRYIELLLDEASRMRRARSCRGVAKNLPLGERMRYTGQMLGTLFLRTLDRAERVNLAMRCRGLGRNSLQSEPIPMATGTLLVGAVVLASTVGYLLRA